METRKQIDGALAHYLIAAAGAFGRLECELTFSVGNHEVQKHLQELKQSIEMVEFYLKHPGTPHADR